MRPPRGRQSHLLRQKKCTETDTTSQTRLKAPSGIFGEVKSLHSGARWEDVTTHLKGSGEYFGDETLDKPATPFDGLTLQKEDALVNLNSYTDLAEFPHPS